jgi:2-oxo-4-hydroxy-4-carboxy-5-ureidoimidazoline decarboxylase
MTHTALTLDLAAVNRMHRDEFVDALGSTFEHSPWVAERAWAARPFKAVEDLHAAMMDAVRSAPSESKIAFLFAHPELAGKEAQAGTMTRDSAGEQASAGLDALNRDEVAELSALNLAYRKRHGFPFIIAVRRYSKTAIFEQLRRRLANDSAAELDEALSQIAAITRLRLQTRLGT